MQCEVIGCAGEARWDVKKNFGKRDSLKLCDDCKPKRQTQWYDVRPLGMDEETKPLKQES